MGKRNTGSWKARQQVERLGWDAEQAARQFEQDPTPATVFTATAAAERLTTWKLLSTEQTPAKVVEVVAEAAQACDDGLARLAALPGPQVQCRAGCAWCCTLTVVTSIPEVLAIVAYLRTTRDADELSALTARVQAAATERSGMAWKARFSRLCAPCLLLVDGLCSIYPVRPFACRGWNSSDAGRCELAATAPNDSSDVPTDGVVVALAHGTQAGLQQAVALAGCDEASVELVAALAIALAEPDAAERWLAGERLFAPAHAPAPPGGIW